jgi:hypothetical protein
MKNSACFAVAVMAVVAPLVFCGGGIVLVLFVGPSFAPVAPSPTAPGANGAEIGLTEAYVGPVHYLDALGNHQIDDTRRLHLVVKIYNITGQTIDYRSWQTSVSDVSLTDEAGTGYAAVDLGPGKRVIRLAPSFTHQDALSIEDQQAVEDLLLFERPAKQTKMLTLKLPLAHIGGSGNRILIAVGSSLVEKE